MKFAIIFLATLLTGCATIIVPLKFENNGTAAVIDNRMDKRLEIILYETAGTRLVSFETELPIAEAIGRSVGTLPSSVEITLEEINLRNTTTLFSPDDVTCKLRSSLMTNNHRFEVKTFTRITGTSYNLISSMVKDILNPCLADHGRDIRKAVADKIVNR